MSETFSAKMKTPETGHGRQQLLWQKPFTVIVYVWSTVTLASAHQNTILPFRYAILLQLSERRSCAP